MKIPWYETDLGCFVVLSIIWAVLTAAIALVMWLIGR